MPRFLFPFRSTVLLATAFSLLVLSAAGTEMIKCQFKNQINNDALLIFAHRVASLDSNCFGRQVLAQTCSRLTAAVVPSSLARQFGMLVVEFVQWRVFGTRNSLLLNLRDLLSINCAVKRFERISLLMGNLSALLLCFFLCNGAPAQSITGSNALVDMHACISLVVSSLLSIVSLSRRFDRIN